MTWPWESIALLCAGWFGLGCVVALVVGPVLERAGRPERRTDSREAMRVPLLDATARELDALQLPQELRGYRWEARR